MNFNTIIEAIMANPISLFILGAIAGFFLRGLLGSLFAGQSNGKKNSRYRSRKPETDVNRSAVVIDFKEPAVDWSENTVKKIARQSSRYASEVSQLTRNLQQSAE